MKAILWTEYGPPDLLQIGEVEKPVPKDDEVLIKVHAATAMPGDCELRRFDIHVLFWLPLRIYLGIFKPKRRIPGMELAGEIIETGSEVKNFKTGDKIIAGCGLGLGAYAEYKCLRADAFMAIKPVNMNYGEAATIPTGGINALHYMRKAKIQPGEKLLINGAAGCFGTYAVQIAKLYGAEVTAVDSTEKLEMLSAIGADHVIDYTKEDYFRNGRTYDVIFDVRGDHVAKGMKVLNPNGRYVLATPWVFAVLQGLFLEMWNSKKFFFALASEKVEDLIHLKELIEAGKLKAVVDKSFPLEKVPRAHQFVESGQKTGHVVIDISSS